MTITQVIERLEELRDAHGNVSVEARNAAGDSTDLDPDEIRFFEDKVYIDP